MLMAMAVIAATTRKALERECAACGTKTVFPPSHRRIAVGCPECGATIPPKRPA
jgi:ribosomal protein S27E